MPDPAALATPDALRVIVFTALWTAAWVLAPRRLSPARELAAGLIPFGLFGLRVFAGFFEEVPAGDPVYRAVEPLVRLVNGEIGGLSYQIMLDVGVVIGMVWFAAAFDIPPKTRRATAWLLPLAGVGGLAHLASDAPPPGELVTRALTPWGAALLVSIALSLLVRFSPSDLTRHLRRDIAIRGSASILAIVIACGIATMVFRALGLLEAVQWARPASVLIIAAALGLIAMGTSPLERFRSRGLFAGWAAVLGGAISWHGFG